jgi:DNA-binding CsgD family transcriptional regulator
MTKSDTLRLRDVRDALRLIGECRDLGSDPVLWFPHLLDGIRRLLGALHTSGGEGWWPIGEPVRAVSAFDSTDDAAAHRSFLAYHRAQGHQEDPFLHAVAAVPGRLAGRLVTRTRRQLVSDDDWFRSSMFQDYRRPAGIGYEMTSLLTTSPYGAGSIIAVNRALGERDYSLRERRWLFFLHHELGRLLGGPLAIETELGPDALPPRLRQTLACLAEGDSEKHIAARLGLSQATVHQYVTMLYRRFRVRSRAQLLAHVMRRLPNERWRGLRSAPTRR